MYTPSAIVGGIGDFRESQRGEPVIDFRSGHRIDVEARLRGDDCHFIARLDDESLENIESGDEKVLKMKPLEVF